MTFETVIIYRFKSYDIRYMYDSANNVIGFEYSQLSEINETLKATRIYYEKNLQGDVTGLLDARGAEIASYTYDAWGNVITDTEKSFCYELILKAIQIFIICRADITMQRWEDL